MREKDVISIKQFIHQRKFDEALQIITSNLELSHYSNLENPMIDENQNNLLLLKSYVLLESNNNNESIEICEIFLNEKAKFPLEVEFSAYTLIADAYWKLQNDNKCRITMEDARRKLEKIDNLIDNDYTEYLAIFRKNEGNLLDIKHKHKDAIEKFLESLALYEKVGNKFRQGSMMQSISLTYRILGDFENATKYILTALEIYKNNGEKLEMSKCQNILGILAVDQKEYDEAFDIFKANLETIKSINNDNELSRAYCNISLMLLDQGKLVQAKKYAKDALEIAELHNDQIKICRYLNNLGLIYWYQSNFSSALKCYNQSLKIIQTEKYELDKEYILVLGNLGYLYGDMGEFEESEHHFITALSFLKSIDGYEEIADYMQLPYLLFGLILVNLDLKDDKKSNRYYEDLNSLTKDNKDDYLNSLNDLATALLLKSKHGLADKFKSQSLLENIIQQETIEYKFLLMAIFHLCDLYLIELKVSENEEVFSKLRILIDKLISVAEDQNIPIVKAQAYVLKSKISLILLEVEDAMQYIKTSKEICYKNELETLIFQIEKDESDLVANINRWQSQISGKSKLAQLVKETQVEAFLKIALSSYSPK